MSNLELFEVLKTRFEENINRHKDIKWGKVKERFISNPDKIKSLFKMEEMGGEPDVIGQDKNTGEYIFCDCSKETPKGRRNICYDLQGEELRNKKGIYPEGNAIEMAKSMKIEILDEEQYQILQKLGEFDTKTSSWLRTLPEIRKLGGAIFGDCRYGHVFIYHNSAPSFYGTRGFRGLLRI